MNSFRKTLYNIFIKLIVHTQNIHKYNMYAIFIISSAHYFIYICFACLGVCLFVCFSVCPLVPNNVNIAKPIGPKLCVGPDRGEEGQPQQVLVQAIFSPFSRPIHLEILVIEVLVYRTLIFFVNFSENHRIFFGWFQGENYRQRYTK